MFLFRKVKQSCLNYINLRDSKISPPPFNERLIEYSFALRKACETYPKKVLDVGTGTTALPSLLKAAGCEVLAIDNIIDYWPAGMVNKHFYVVNDDITNTHLDERFDLITCISVLEHIDQFDAAIKNMSKLLNKNGILVLTCPYNEKNYCENVYDLDGSNAKGLKLAFKTRAFSRKNIISWETENSLKLVDQEFWQFFSGAYWTQGERVIPPVKTSADDKHQIACFAFKKI